MAVTVVMMVVLAAMRVLGEPTGEPTTYTDPLCTNQDRQE
jgi:hypothetical protein